MEKPKATDILVECNNPAALDNILQNFGAALIQDDLEKKTYLQKEGYYVARCFSDPNFITFVLTNQGYAKVIRVLDKLF